MRNQDENRDSIRGKIAPVDWDSAGAVVRLSITAADGDRYILGTSGKGEELFQEIGRTIDAKGRIEDDAYGDPVFVVNEYTFC
jgi:hypothetical protein